MPGIRKHHAAVGLDARTADLDRFFHRFAQAKRSFEVFEDVANGYWLSSCYHPTRADHDRQPFGQAADDFERRTAVTDDDAGPKFDEGWPKFTQHRARFVPALEMR